ncbi:uncharacterized protein LOC141593153 [Silene latifolia]|uniref:uncharacterized protein LOC141593153 n=1 Tax=Silene latifolia TaxID=37657 RepID=UPI003D782D17
MAGYVGDWWLQQQQDYTIRNAYDWLGSPCVKVPWAKFVWDTLALPRQCFIGWLVMHRILLTKDRLKRMEVITDVNCVLCAAAPETHSHLFSDCEYSQKCLPILSHSLVCHLPGQGWSDWWTRQKSHSQSLKYQIVAALLALIYAIWWSRNHCRLEGILMRPEFIVARIDEHRKACFAV